MEKPILRLIKSFLKKQEERLFVIKRNSPVFMLELTFQPCLEKIYVISIEEDEKL